eukprot:CAMPEP_0170494874 /NCGR_PEP_ID=MMETSP0208-20121228/14889_1 /TAXON_ID=197538 /ORGANISM="Strombidium inclinatum, Strain S3" /LENGTH=34 /DNA_ID= /DNA_START= /DNA_END= /DNA_ORIENTATION=
MVDKKDLYTMQEVEENFPMEYYRYEEEKGKIVLQ